MRRPKVLLEHKARRELAYHPIQLDLSVARRASEPPYVYDGNCLCLTDLTGGEIEVRFQTEANPWVRFTGPLIYRRSFRRFWLRWAASGTDTGQIVVDWDFR